MQLIKRVFEFNDAVRYMAVYKNGVLEMQSRPGIEDASSSHSDEYEELLVNPTIIKLLSQRGNIDCGGLDYVLVRYGSFFQYVQAIEGGHVSICLESDADVMAISRQLTSLIEQWA